MAIKNIIFDFGGVLLNLNPGKTDAAFDALIGDKKLYQQLYQQLYSEGLFDQFEIGAIDENTFLNRLKEVHPHPIRTEQLRRAWNVMLLDFPHKRIEMLENLRSKGLNLYLLSNINSIHLSEVYLIIQEELGLTNIEFEQLFDGIYYSHLIGYRKPNASTFEYVINDANLDVSETLFIDDTLPNIVGAKSIGLHAIHHIANSDIVGSIDEYLQLQ